MPLLFSGVTPKGWLSTAHDFEGALDLKSSTFWTCHWPSPVERESETHNVIQSGSRLIWKSVDQRLKARQKQGIGEQWWFLCAIASRTYGVSPKVGRGILTNLSAPRDFPPFYEDCSSLLFCNGTCKKGQNMPCHPFENFRLGMKLFTASPLLLHLVLCQFLHMILRETESETSFFGNMYRLLKTCTHLGSGLENMNTPGLIKVYTLFSPTIWVLC